MATIIDLQARGLRYGVIVDAAVTQATLDDLDRRGLRYKAEVAVGVSAASRAALDARGLRYFVPVAVGVAEADKASLDRQGLRYAVQVDADILPADRAVLERQGLRYFVEVDSSGTAIATAVGGAILLADEANGFATDFTHAVDTERVAVKTAGTVVASGLDSFYSNAGTSPKQVYDVAGALVWSPHNLALQSQTFDNASWSKNAFTVTANATAAPDGTTTADACIPPAGTVSPYTSQFITVINGSVVTLSTYIKNGTLGTSWFLILIDSGGNKSAWFNYVTGVKGSISGATSSNMTAVGSGWYRCDVTFTAGAASATPYLSLTSGDGVGATSSTGDGVKPAFYLWGAQINRGAVPTAYIPTTTAARYGLAIDYDPVTHAAKGLLCEPAATNLAIESAIGRPGFLWQVQGATGTTSAQTDPAGGTQAIQVVVTTASGNNLYKQINVTNGATYTGSMWLKGTLGQQIYLSASTGQVGAHNKLVTFTGNWQRETSTVTANAATVFLACETYNRGGGAHLPNVTFHAWGAQLETGAVATSHIPTLAATVTRARDGYNCTPASIGYSATAGSWWTEAYLMGGVGSDEWIIGSSTAASPLFYNTGGVSIRDGTQLFIPPGPAITNNTNKFMSAFATGSRAVTYNGQAPATDVGAVTNILAQSYIGIGCSSGGTSTMNGYLRKLRYLPRRPSNAELVTMTT